MSLWRDERQVCNLSGVGNTLTSVELFSGGGGLALGVHLAGLRHLRLVEFDPVACETVRANNRSGFLRPEWPIDEADIHGYDLSQFAGRVTFWPPVRLANLSAWVESIEGMKTTGTCSPKHSAPSGKLSRRPSSWKT